MSVKATSEVTIMDETDLDSLVTWYKLQTSATPPAAPTTTRTSDAVSGWVQAEPTFSAGTVTNYLYTVIQTRWKDGSCSWGTVQMSSSYEQAKQAWNKANAAQSSVDNLEIGGKNYISKSAGVLVSGLGSAAGSRAEYRALNVGKSYMDIEDQTQVTISFDLYMTVNTANPSLQVYNTNNDGPKCFRRTAGSGEGDSVTLYFTAAAGTVINKRVSVTGYIADRTNPTTQDNYLEFYSGYGTSNWFSISNIKLEKGNKDTDWTPSIEDYADIGGRNLLVSAESSLTGIKNGGSTKSFNITAWVDNLWTKTWVNEHLTVGENYILSYDATLVSIPSGYTATPETRSAPIMLDQGASWVKRGPNDDGVTDNRNYSVGQTHHYEFVFKFQQITGAQEYYGLCAYTVLRKNSSGGTAKDTFTISNLKLQRGNKSTDWTPAPEDLAAATDSVEYIVGTQTASTGSWTGVTKDSALYTGKTIAYKLPYEGSGNATLELTLSGGGTTGAKAVYSMTTRVTTHYPANSIIQMTYNGTDWRTTGWYNTDTVNRTRLQNVIKAAAAITSGKIICGTASGYRDVAANVSFDLAYPLLYCGTTKAANETSDNNFLQINGIKLTNTGAVQGAANYKNAYLKGTVTGNTFKVASSDFLTCDVPTSDDGFCYVPLGMFYNSTTNIYFNSSKELYAYKDGAFGPVSIREASVAKGMASDAQDAADEAKGAADVAQEAANDAHAAANAANDQARLARDEAAQAGKTATDYITDISGVGVKVHPSDDPGSYALLTGGGMEVYSDSQKVAEFGETVLVGAIAGAHVEMSGNRLSFKVGEMEVAYVAVDSDTHESLFYMTKAIIVQDLRFSNWQWRSRENDNLALKWIGGDE